MDYDMPKDPEGAYGLMPSTNPSMAGQACDSIAMNRRQRRPTTREQIQKRIAGLKAQVEKHERVLAILDQNTGMENALDALRDIGI